MKCQILFSGDISLSSVKSVQCVLRFKTKYRHSIVAELQTTCSRSDITHYFALNPFHIQQMTVVFSYF